MTSPMMIYPFDWGTRAGDQAPYDDDGYSWGSKRGTNKYDLLSVVSYLLSFPCRNPTTHEGFLWSLDTMSPIDGWSNE